MRHALRKGSGFTLVELLVVIAIIGLLSGIILTNLSSSRSKARDAQQISDLGQLQLALSLYYDRCGQYPLPSPLNSGFGGAWGPLNTSANNCNASGIALSSFISTIPVPPPGSPKAGAYYGYAVNSATDPTDYILFGQLEGYNEVLKNSMSASAMPSWTSSLNIPCYGSSGSEENGITSGGNYYCLGSH